MLWRKLLHPARARIVVLVTLTSGWRCKCSKKGPPVGGQKEGQNAQDD